MRLGFEPPSPKFCLYAIYWSLLFLFLLITTSFLNAWALLLLIPFILIYVPMFAIVEAYITDRMEEDKDK